MTESLPTKAEMNMRLIGHNDLDGFGNVGEGMDLHVSADGRRTLFLAHAFAPKDITALDVTDPSDPTIIFQSDLPHDQVRSNNLSLSGDIMAVTRQAMQPGGEPAGTAFFDVSNPEKPEQIGFFDASGNQSIGTHFVWFVDGRYAYLSTGMPDFNKTHLDDRLFPLILDAGDPTNPVEVGRWWLPGTRAEDPEAPIKRPQEIYADYHGLEPEKDDRYKGKWNVGDWHTFDSGYRSHNIYVHPDRPDRAYVGYINGGVIVLDISDKANPSMVGRLEYSPPYPGYSHTVMPLLDRELLVITDECIAEGAADWPKLMWIADMRYEKEPRMISTAPQPPVEDHWASGSKGRFGAHNIHENLHKPQSWQSEDVVFGTFFASGVRAYGLGDPYRPELIGHLVPETPKGQEDLGIQLNDLYVDENGIIYAGDRTSGGLYVIEFDAEAALSS